MLFGSGYTTGYIYINKTHKSFEYFIRKSWAGGGGGITVVALPI